MARIDWSKIPKDVKDKIHMDMYGMDSPCMFQGVECPMAKYGIDCDKDNDSHCAFSDFIFHCLEVRKCKQQ